jgi:phenylacetate-CoA ligase
VRYVSSAGQTLYEWIPVWTRSAASTVYGLVKMRRENTPLFQKYLKELRQTQWYSSEQLADLQQRRLQKLIRHAATSVPYYARAFAAHGVVVSQIQTPGDLAKLPTLSKATIRRSWREMIAQRHNVSRLRKESTSGTTGTPLTVYMDDEAYLQTKAVQWLQHEWAGYTHREWLGVLAGYRVVPIGRTTPPFWVTNFAGRQIHLSSYNLRPAVVDVYAHKIRSSGIRFLLGYPSAIGYLARSLNEKGNRVPLEAVFLSSEPIYEWQLQAIRSAFGCKVFNYYGQGERVLSGVSCGTSNLLHLSMESSVAEFVPSAGGEGTKLLSTSLLNFAMPLIRYELHDIATVVEDPCPCGRAHQRIQPVETKEEDYVVTPSGRFVSPSLLTFPLKDVVGVERTQVIQDSVEHLDIRIVTNEKFTEEEEHRLKREFSRCVGMEMEVKITRVEDIPLTAQGKFRFVVSHVARVAIGLCLVLLLGSAPNVQTNRRNPATRCRPQTFQRFQRQDFCHAFNLALRG